MPDFVHDFPINAPAAKVFTAFSAPEGLDEWWTKSSEGTPKEGESYHLYFGPGYDWRASVTHCTPGSEFELQMTDAHPDWMHSKVGVALSEKDGVTNVRFHHTGWPEANEHYRISCYCWAMYLRILKRFVENGERVGYDRRLEV